MTATGTSAPAVPQEPVGAPASALPPWLVAAGVQSGRGLEIGPLAAPRLIKGEVDVLYVDHASTAELHAKYAEDLSMRDRLDEIVDVDAVWDGSTSLAEVLGDRAPVDFVLASHVVEHAPDVIGWLRQIEDVLVDGGRLCLVIPDMRLCFDVNRDLTTMGDLVDAHLRGLVRPSPGQVYDFHSRMVAVDAAAMWAGTADYRGLWRSDVDPDDHGWALAQQAMTSDDYLDAHCSVFTPASFLDLFARIARLGLTELAVSQFVGSQPGTIEFCVVLERLPRGLDPAARLAAQLASVPTDTPDLVPPRAGDAPPPSVPAPEPAFIPSPLELRLLLAKRRVLGPLSRARARRRR